MHASDEYCVFDRRLVGAADVCVHVLLPWFRELHRGVSFVPGLFPGERDLNIMCSGRKEKKSVTT